MIITLTGKVEFPLTLDPSVWIFDDRKVLFENAFKEAEPDPDTEEKHWDRSIYQQKMKPPINKSLTREERKKALENSYVMPIADFIATANVHDDATHAVFVTETGEESVGLDDFKESMFLFAVDGRSIKETGPAHCYLPSKKEQPIKAIRQIRIS
ncbi:hypothetical protein [Terribacillus sp. DMT04]|uniref:hypothetical protein n=1 Tax=Terribacillus sp. DMT04 TaxID=2850441 RepID=UPI001C2BF6FB|nr:hypothetical protein [Terribacillus sp. DMT04]QXE02975.1 hypothetical protein KS242_07340 [Terribacillus sp. DMT04]